MARIDEARDRLQRLRAAHTRHEADLRVARARVDRLARQLKGAKRTRERSQDAIAADLAKARHEVERLTREAKTTADALGEGMIAFEPLLDPRTAVESLDDAIPLLLLPVRLEVRFKRQADNPAFRQLWVRIFPDDCAIDTFEPTLSDREVASARTFWTAMWAAAGDEPRERAAWRDLVSSHGAGRAAWIVKEYRPANEPDKPGRPDPTAVILSIAAAPPLPSVSERSALATFWSELWRANGEAAASAAAAEALATAVGADRAAGLVKSFIPANLPENPPAPGDRAGVTVVVAFVEFSADLPTSRTSWTRPATTRLMPDCFVLRTYADDGQMIEYVGRQIPSFLHVGPDPQAGTAEEQFQSTADDLVVPDSIRWMTDFDRAVDWGLGFKIDLLPEQADLGFARLVVLGVKTSQDAAASTQVIEEWITQQFHSRGGFAILRQGTPTNNTESNDSGHSSLEDSDASFESSVRGGQAYALSDDWLQRRDGEWLSRALGIDPAILQPIASGASRDAAEACAANAALWPATGGYMMRTLLRPIFDPAQIDATAAFFQRYVTGRGLIPAIRVGRQPYGILLATAFSRMAWFKSIERPMTVAARLPAGESYLAGLYRVLMRMYPDWATAAQQVSRVGGPSTDAHQTLLDIVGLHPASVEFHQRYAESVDQLFNELKFRGAEGALLAALDADGYAQRLRELLVRLGAAGAVQPDLAGKLFLDHQNRLNGPIVDDQPLSETRPIRAYTPGGRNYIAWLIAAARTSLETARREDGFVGEVPPDALLYLLLRHALLLGYWETSVRLRVDAGVIDSAGVMQLSEEPNFIHVAADADGSESRWSALYRPEPTLTGSGVPVHQYVRESIGAHPAAAPLAAWLNALDALSDVPTARLERVLAEHIDCCSYRFDAWLLGLVRHQLVAMREAMPSGVHLGAYGVLEDVRPKPATLEPVVLTPELATVFGAGASGTPLMRDPTNGGHVHAPSLNQAVAAAILRSGYLANASAENPSTLAVNLSSARVRVALSILDGIRTGQSLGALLGYRFERALHDRGLGGGVEVDVFVFALRKAFPLRADRLASTRSAPDAPIEAIEARNVVDGLRLVQHVQSRERDADRRYPFGLTLPAATNTQVDAMTDEVRRLIDIHDAVADLGAAESVYQTLIGNADRAAATLDTYAKAQFPTEPQIVQTPRSGTTITHRFGLHFRTGLDPNVSPVAGVTVTPRARTEPAVNAWLATLLPPPDAIGCVVSYFDATTRQSADRFVTQQDLGLQPIDLLYIVDARQGQGMAELDDRIAAFVTGLAVARPDGGLTIQYTAPSPGNTTFFEAAPLIRHLRALLLSSRTLKPSDLALHNEASRADDLPAIADKARLAPVVSALTTVADALVADAAAIDALVADVDANIAALLAGVDTRIDAYAQLSARAATLGIPQSGWGFAYDWRNTQFASLIKRVDDLVNSWTATLAEFDGRLSVYDALPAGFPANERMLHLQRAERLIVGTPRVAPPAPNAFRAALTNDRARFVAKQARLIAVTDSTSTRLAPLLAAVAAELPLDEYDPRPYQVDDVVAAIVDFQRELAARARLLAANARRRATAGQGVFDEFDALADPNARAVILERAAKALLGDDALFVTEFMLPSPRATELDSAIQLSVSGRLFRHLTGSLGVAFPIDEWLLGIARVRRKLRAWEQTQLLSAAFVGAVPALDATQLPFDPDDYWLGLEYPSDYVLDGDRLLYTAHFAAAFQPAGRQCGLLIDEWTEVLPATSETTGLAFHFDRPGSEAPQTLLLVTPPVFRGAWQWADVADAIVETLDLARIRAVEPRHLDDTAYATLLPATVAATAQQEISIMTDFGRNNGVHLRLER